MLTFELRVSLVTAVPCRTKTGTTRTVLDPRASSTKMEVEHNYINQGAVLLIGLWILYKVLDRLIRLPMTSKPTTERDHILITGCDHGFGNLFAKRLDAKGFHVFAACLTEQGKRDLEAATSDRLKAFLMDVTDEASLRNGHKFVTANLPENKGLWAVVNNAGISPTNAMGPAEWLRKSDFNLLMDVNFYGMMCVTNTFLSLLKKGGGRVVNTSSILGRIAGHWAASYVASKYAVEGYSDCIRRELRPFGISVHIIEPGYFATPMAAAEQYSRAMRDTWERLSPDVKASYGEDYIAAMIETSEEARKSITPKLHLVVDAYEHAVLGTFPRGRYLVGTDANYVFWPVSLLPEWLSDVIMMWEAPIPKEAKH